MNAKKYCRALKRFAADKNYRIRLLAFLGFYNSMPDEKYLKMLYKANTGEELNLENPVKLNEKLQWLKLHDRKPVYTQMADKYRAREYIASKVGREYLIPLLGVWERAEDIDFDSLPDSFVLKCNHTSSTGLCVCRDKSRLDRETVRKKLTKAMAQNYYLVWREWPYKDIPRRIIAEQFLSEPDGSPLVDYKFYCYGGEPRYFMVSYGEAEHNVKNHKFDMQLNSIDYLFKKQPAVPAEEIKLPENIDKMIELAGILCRGHQHLRVDMYSVGGRIYCGELTFFSGGGFIKMVSQEYSDYLAGLIDLKACVEEKSVDD